ncbi:MAG TPA: hypothetical protein VEB21_01770 [Terriglobales bacterium]|nr:hypothetical protein [Terriglobales bacterium]
MAKVKAGVEQADDKYFLALHLPTETVRIPMSDDNPNHVKKAFNRLIEHARSKDFSIELETVGDDLFSQVASEYVRQLNREIKGLRAEMKQYGLIV